MLFDFDPPRFDREGLDWPNREASRFVLADGIRWHVQVMGEGEPVLLLHGTGGATHSWRDLAPLLATRFSLIMPDLPGHGFTQAPPNARMGLPEMARSVGLLTKALGVAPRLSVGHSAGCAILLRGAIDGWLNFEAIVGLAAALMPFRGLARDLFPAAAKLLVLNPIVPRVFSWGADEAGVRRLIEGTGSSIDARGIDLYRRLMATSGHCAAALAMMARWDLESLTRDIARYQGRLTLIVPGGDKAVPAADAAEIAARRPDTRVVPLSGLGHLAHEEAPEVVARVIEAALCGAE